MLARRFKSDDSAVSPVVGVILMVAITVLLAATAATFFLDFGSGSLGQNAPQAAFTFDYESGSPDSLTIEHRSGDSIQAGNLYITVSGASTANGQHDFTSLSGAPAAGSKITAGSRVTFSKASDLSDAAVTLNWKSPDSGKSIQLASWEAP
ncbi:MULTISPECIES: type IV pilin [Haloarcula]|uniref:Type IV pilin n=2 Tax=Haloarcula marismortui TaxID=2238 RepID=Q5V490_HALMA|nr:MULTISPECIES: type IV pilin N-terminal domain-containing protein [Haloarcula]AAV45662.1 unknown [Haloarcula marismortui ATCC 43049]NHX38514.1 type IV pilin [Haloarcula sp. R1-2]QCP90443.1 type IV pilin [Haloarcula marismortui ATCC 43049]